MTSQFLPQWTVPEPPPSDERTIRPGRVVLGIGAAILGHLIAGVIGIAGYVGAVGNGPFRLILAGPVAQAFLGVVCLPVSIVWMTKRNRGFGIGLLAGWVVGLILIVTFVLGLLLFVVYWGQGPGK